MTGRLRGWLTSWRLPLRLARRGATRARGRSILVLVMIALPVLGVTAADVVLSTQDVDSAESLDRRLGAASAEVTAMRVGGVVQAPDPDEFSTWTDEADEVATARQVSEVLGGARLVPHRSGAVDVTTDKGVDDVETTEVDLRDPVALGLADLSEGRLPAARGEVVVNAELAAKGYGVGDRLDLRDEDLPDPVVVGLAESPTVRDRPVAMGPVGVFGPPPDAWVKETRSWLVAGGAVTWAEVRALNALGATVLSRAVVLDPPPLPPEAEEWVGSSDDAFIAVVVLVVVMALIEVVLLAGPAFAVGARKQSRNLALLAATGGTPRQARRIVLAGALVLGSVASLLGVGLGIVAGGLLMPLLQRWSSSWFGPFDVPWLHLVGIAAFGLVSAVSAALVPAWIASRQDVVAVLAGRRGDRRPSLRSPLLGVLLLGAGVALATYGAVGRGSGAYLIAASAIVAVLGMILLVPVVLVGLARVSGRLPLVLRYAVRDATRHRTRTVPAVAAVAATVAGVVALGIATQSDEAQNRASYVPMLAAGAATLTWYGEDVRWDAARAILEREVPDAEVVEVRGADPAGGFLDIGTKTVAGRRLLDSYGSAVGSDVLVGDEASNLLIDVPDRAVVAEVLADGGAVAFSNRGVEGRQEVGLVVRPYDDEGRRAGRGIRSRLVAEVVPVGPTYSGPQLLLSRAAAGEAGIDVAPVSLGVTGTDITTEQEEAVSESLAAFTQDAGFTVERGYQSDDETAIIQAVLAGLGAVLMLGGTLTATFLALSDARPDLATLAAVGAAPRTRRGVAAAYALVVGFVGAALGAAVGFVPGIAISYPLTSIPGDTCIVEGSGGCVADGTGSGPFLDVPWLMIGGLVLLLPLLTALVVGLTARSRLPLVARMD